MENTAIIAASDTKALGSVLQRIGEFQSLMRTQLVEGQDYGRIPGCGDKPALLKPGAEKITVLLGLRTKFEVIRQVEDFDGGFFFYAVRCSLVTASGEVVSEGLGSCNTRESRFRRQDPYTAANVALKMARKRALVDAALTVGSLSNLFTQDIDDMGGTFETHETRDNAAPAPASASARDDEQRGGGCTDAQARKIAVMMRKCGMAESVLRQHVIDTYGVSKVYDLSKEQASQLIDRLEEHDRKRRERGAAA